MRTKKRPLPVLSALALWAAIWANPLWGQAGRGAGSTEGDKGANPSNGGLSSEKAAARLAKDDAKALVKSNRVKSAEDALSRLNKSAPNTPAWSFETSHKLIDLADELRREGNSSLVPALAQQSLQRLNEVANGNNGARIKADAKAASAIIYERFIGDVPAAITHYQAAAQLDPGNMAVKEALEHLQKAEANLRAKIRPAKRK